jgi:aconitate hydratase
MLLGIRAVIAESFERIYRSNLVGMGVLPLVFKNGMTRKTLELRGDETIDILGLDSLSPRMDIDMLIHRADGTTDKATLLCRVDTRDDVMYYENGGILQYVLRSMARAA